MHVNTAFSDEGQNVNCAMCTAAALTGQCSGDVNADLQRSVPSQNKWGPFESDQAFVAFTRSNPSAQAKRVNVNNQAIQPIADQMVGIAVYVAQKKGGGTQVKFFGNPVARTRGSDVIPSMLKQADGTEFAVFTADGASMYGDEAHWIYAKKEGGKIRYYDYQTDRQLMKNASPAQADKPIRPGGTAYDSAENTFMIAVAFGKNLKG